MKGKSEKVEMKKVDWDKIHPYGAKNGSNQEFYHELIADVGDLKRDEMLEYKITSSNYITRSKSKIQQAYPGVYDELEIFTRTVKGQKYLYVRYKR